MSIVSTLKNPPIWSPAYNPMIWEVLSDQTSQFKFRYVFDVYINEDAYLRYKIPANPGGAGIIDVSSLVQGALAIAQNLPFLSDKHFYDGQNMAAEVYCKVGEEYAASATSTPILYDGLGNIGSPAYGLYADDLFNPAPNSTSPVVAYAAAQGATENYDYQATGGEDIMEYIMDSPIRKFLRTEPDNPSQIRSDETVTLSWLNWDFLAATGPRAVPYAMKTTLSQNGVTTGEKVTYNTITNGGQWSATGSWNNPSAATGPTSSAFYLSNFKQDLTTLTDFVMDQDYFFGDDYGCGKNAIGTIFPSTITASLSPATAFAVANGPTAGFLQPQNQSDCTGGLSLGTTGYSGIAYRTMTVDNGSVINITVKSQNNVGTSYPTMYLYGSTGTPTSGATWESISAFTSSGPTGGKLTYSITNYTTIKAYTALGIRFQATTTLQPCGSYGCFSDIWTITIDNPEFDQICFQLFPYQTYGSTALGATGISEQVCYNINDDNCWGFEPIRFTWLNSLGGREWYTFIKRNTYTQNAARDTFYQLPGYWSSSQWSIQDLNPSRWGTTVFKVQLENSWTASTDWITEEQSAWLRSMFASPSVHVYLPGRSTPSLITITDASYSVQTYARQKLFQYFVSFVEAQPDIVQSY